eukprot:TRINITY_DN926_c2_g2_i1.p1 TRINITY_DN926_c2_g2~~TRINITY_DN926_c2_g2_i1.p1  ORF type:complete len:487 (+),score=143.18 TRINITY_DN926_c2_g2_i1:66-1526(+)
MNVLLDDLQRLADLHQNGLLSAGEFKASKALVLGYASIRLAVAAKQATRRTHPPAPHAKRSRSQSRTKNDGNAVEWANVHSGLSGHEGASHAIDTPSQERSAEASSSVFYPPVDDQWRGNNAEDVEHLVRYGMDPREVQRLERELEQQARGENLSPTSYAHAHDVVEAMLSSTAESKVAQELVRLTQENKDLMFALEKHLDGRGASKAPQALSSRSLPSDKVVDSKVTVVGYPGHGGPQNCVQEVTVTHKEKVDFDPTEKEMLDALPHEIIQKMRIAPGEEILEGTSRAVLESMHLAIPPPSRPAQVERVMKERQGPYEIKKEMTYTVNKVHAHTEANIPPLEIMKDVAVTVHRVDQQPDQLDVLMHLEHQDKKKATSLNFPFMDQQVINGTDLAFLPDDIRESLDMLAGPGTTAALPAHPAPKRRKAVQPQSAEQIICAALQESSAVHSALTHALSKSNSDNDEISALLLKQAGITNRRCITPPL